MKTRLFLQKAAQAAFFVVPALSAAQSSGDSAQLGALLGADEAAVQQAYPGLHKIARPIAGPRSTRGLWELSSNTLAGLRFDTVFYFRARRLERIEQRSVLAPSVCAKQFDQLTTTLEARMGGAVRSSAEFDSSGRSATWSMETYRIAAFQILDASRCTVMLVHEPLSTRDAAEL